MFCSSAIGLYMFIIVSHGIAGMHLYKLYNHMWYPSIGPTLGACLVFAGTRLQLFTSVGLDLLHIHVIINRKNAWVFKQKLWSLYFPPHHVQFNARLLLFCKHDADGYPTLDQGWVNVYKASFINILFFVTKTCLYCFRLNLFSIQFSVFMLKLTYTCIQ